MPKGMTMTGRKEDGTKGQVGLANQAQLWKTPSAQEPGTIRKLVNADGTPWRGGERAYDPETGRLVQTGLPQQIDHWTTPQAHDVSPRGSGQVPTTKAGNACLARDAMNWPTPMAGTPARNGNSEAGNNDFTRRVDAILETWGTPRASDAEKGGPHQAFGAGGKPLPSQAANWPTATTRDHKGSSETSLTRKDGKSRLDMLDFAAEQGFSRPDPATMQRGLPSSQWRPTSRRLLRSVTSHVALTSLRRWLRRGNWRKRRLNPIFVEWLMGWPKGHALCASSETEWCLWQQHMRGALSVLPTASAGWIWQPPAQTETPTQAELL